MMELIGRAEELNVLEDIFNSKRAEFLALYGRRRVGKTYLIRQFFVNKSCVFLNITGSKDGTLQEQLNHFIREIGDTFYGGASLAVPKSWDVAFDVLTKAMQNQEQTQKIILFFDELPWLATRNSRFLQNLDYYWNHHWSNDLRIKLIICGSSASWIVKKIINARGGLHNRITYKIRLSPFSLCETKLYLVSQGINLPNKQILQIYMVTGGVPYYLSHLKKGLSASQLIDNIAFNERGLLLDEFDNLFASLFDDSASYIKIIEIIANKKQGIGKREILEKLGKEAIGSVGLNKLDELEEAGFIMGFMPYGHKRQGIYYKLIDEYTLFYYKWIVPIKNKLHKKMLQHGSWQMIHKSPEWNNWQGYAFEMICFKHINRIRKALSIGVDAIADSWRYAPRIHAEERGAQIDLLFDRSDDVITLCEIKCTDKSFVITKEYALELKRKQDVFKIQTKTQKHLFLALISANGIKNNSYAEQMVSNIITLEDFFD